MKRLLVAALAALAACAQAEDPFAPRGGDASAGGDANNADGSPGPDAPVELDELVLNELVFNHTGSDTHEYVEVAGPASTDHSAATLVLVDGDVINAGLVVFVEPVGVTGPAGYWVSSFFENTLENGSQALLLVEGFTGDVGDDLDDDGDGAFDSEPWSRLLDSIAVLDGDAGDVDFGQPVLSPDHPGGTLAVGGASRLPNGADTDQAGDWVRNDFDGAGLACCAGASADPGEAINTPGAANRVQN